MFDIKLDLIHEMSKIQFELRVHVHVYEIDPNLGIKIYCQNIILAAL